MRKKLLAEHAASKLSPKHWTALLVVLLIAGIGTYLLVSSHAASPYSSVTTDQGTVASGATSVSGCVGATDGSCTTFQQSIAMDGNVALDLATTGTPFASSSVWNTPLPNNTPTSSNSADYVSAIVYNLCGDTTATPETPPPACPSSTYYGYLNSTAWSAPLYVVPANQPYVTMQDNCGHASTSYFNTTVLGPGVPIPADAHPAVGSDSEMQIYQPSTDKYWDFWGALKNSSGVWVACWGGVISGVSTSDGIFPNNTGADATSLPLIGIDPRINELRAGQINHVIGLTVGDVASADLKPSLLPANVVTCASEGLPATTPSCAAHGYSWPATRSDGYSTDTFAIPEGQRFRLPANLDLSQYNLTPVAKAIAVAAQKYGFVVNDSSPQPSLTIRIADPTTYTNTPSPNLPNPYSVGPGVGGVGNKGLYAGVSSSLIMKNFPWDQLIALPFNYGEPGS